MSRGLWKVLAFGAVVAAGVGAGFDLFAPTAAWGGPVAALVGIVAMLPFAAWLDRRATRDRQP